MDSLKATILFYFIVMIFLSIIFGSIFQWMIGWNWSMGAVLLAVGFGGACGSIMTILFLPLDRILKSPDKNDKDGPFH